MSTTDTLCFGDHDPVTGPPVIDGLIDRDYLPFDPAHPESFEPGYVNGCRLTFQGGGLPNVMFQGVRVPAGDKIVMGFLCRFDDHFDADDVIVLALRSSFASGPARLVAIYPNLAGVGADAGSGVGPNEIKTGIPATGTRIDFWQDAGPNSWTLMSPDPAGVEVMLRSWLPDRPSGSPNEVAWSVEVSWPRTGADGFTLNDDFGLYFNVTRVLQSAMVVQSAFPTTAPDLMEAPGTSFTVPAWGHGLIPAIQVPPGSNLGVGVHFRNGWQGVGRRALGSGTTTLTDTIVGPAGSDDNEIVALLENNGALAANDIWAEFRFANWGLPPATFPAWDLAQGMGADPTVSPGNPAPHRFGVAPFDPAYNLAPGAQGEIATPWLRSHVPPQYGNSHQCIWVQLNSATNVNFTQSSMRRNMNFATLSEIGQEAEISGEGYSAPADGSGQHDFVLETFCRRLHVFELLSAKRVDPDTRALLKDALGGKLEGNAATAAATGAATTGAAGYRDTVVYLWVARGYRRSGKFMKIRGTSYEILDHRPGEFGVVARHEGVNDPFHFALQGPGLVHYAPGLFGLKVPHRKSTRIKVRLGADKQSHPGDMSELPRAEWPKPRRTESGDGTKDGGRRRSWIEILLELLSRKR